MIYIVCYKEWAHGPKILDQSKTYLSKSKAEMYTEFLNEAMKLSGWNAGDYWTIVEMELEK